MTTYIVLVAASSIDDNETDNRGWIEVGTAEAATPQAAIRAATNGKPADERTGTFVAVPARSWKPVTRRVQTVEKDEWS